MTTRLMIIASDEISAWINKGEVIDRYYNPGNFFEEIHLVLTNHDTPNENSIRRMVGSARLFIHNVPTGRRFFHRTLGFRPTLVNRWANQITTLATGIKPDVVRCYGAHINAYSAHRIKELLGIPYVVSLHINPDEDLRGRATTWSDRIYYKALRRMEKISLRDADLVLPVYESIVPYLRRYAVTRYSVAYNMLNAANLIKKEDYSVTAPVRVASVGRQFKEKNPENLIRAVSTMTNVTLTLYGDGPYHERLRSVARECGISSRVEFAAAIPNDELCRQLAKYDVFALHSDYWELSKSLIEALLVGLPVIINRRIGRPVPELNDEICLMVENSTEGYREALQFLVSDHAGRRRIGLNAQRHAWKLWSPQQTEARFEEIYRQVAAGRQRAA